MTRELASRDLPRWLPSSLRRQLLLGVLAVVSVVLVTVGIVSVLSLRGYVTAMSDADVAQSLDALSNSYIRYSNRELSSAQRGEPIAQAMLEFTDQTPGNLIAVLHDGVVVGSAVFSEAEARPAPPDVVRALETEPWPDVPPRTAKLGSLGSYRVDSRVEGADLLVVGVSLARADQIIVRKQLTTSALIAAALAITAGLTIWVVGVTLRPLRRLVATAAEVAAMPLTDGDHRISVRLRPEDADPHNEVGIVGHTLNRLLDNVDSALAHRAESDLRMRQFLTDASHELRTPLAAIQGYAELTRQDSEALPPTTEYALARIESEARRMALLVDELLLLSRLGEGEDLQTQDVDLADLAVNAVNDAAVAAPTHHWVKDLPDEPVWVRGDHARLHQLVSNLLSNARLHTPPGVTVTTGITCHRKGTEPPYAELTVADDGPGIDDALLPRLFERFVRADSSRSDGSGIGLGLAIVSSIVKAHGGSVTAESTEGRTVFRVRLPMLGDPVTDSA
ncbi:HAMP domain-containing sensor histidine kinase [Mycobacterium sp. 852002-51057_SCH5723018]|uniref:sensor histidine kinase n=1 Tax=Mycobacterium sp. 852002-51057_SCH5723018 TaxID=1834094 RepID=UPI0007FC3A10|nr:HAMP domain-containing sensor histidine kinase [Mycobacterium sp. 852002-51057_SCH5723018]OBG19118.1 two-component sensor histidine kinase [Mycobacterium sp. 852002-51057_SCH5723018]